MNFLWDKITKSPNFLCNTKISNISKITHLYIQERHRSFIYIVVSYKLCSATRKQFTSNARVQIYAI